jgi:hypothetical protein
MKPLAIVLSRMGRGLRGGDGEDNLTNIQPMYDLRSFKIISMNPSVQ